jgi:ferric-dicitrate binding protein FerR (iron transport regulator)
LGKITAVAYPVYSDNARNLRTGQSVDRETVCLSSGLLEFRLQNGVRIIMDGETSLDIQSVSRVFCRKGRISVEVPKGAEGFEVHTALLNVRDLGTEFVVEATPTECSVHVIKGLVEVSPLTQTGSSLSEGNAMIVRGPQYGPNARLTRPLRRHRPNGRESLEL